MKIWKQSKIVQFVTNNFLTVTLSGDSYIFSLYIEDVKSDNKIREENIK